MRPQHPLLTHCNPACANLGFRASRFLTRQCASSGRSSAHSEWSAEGLPQSDTGALSRHPRDCDKYQGRASAGRRPDPSRTASGPVPHAHGIDTLHVAGHHQPVCVPRPGGWRTQICPGQREYATMSLRDAETRRTTTTTQQSKSSTRTHTAPVAVEVSDRPLALSRGGVSASRRRDTERPPASRRQNGQTRPPASQLAESESSQRFARQSGRLPGQSPAARLPWPSPGKLPKDGIGNGSDSSQAETREAARAAPACTRDRLP
jgi:hypothetical protein